MQRNISIPESSFLQCNFHGYFPALSKEGNLPIENRPVFCKYQESLLIIKDFILDDIRDLLSWSLVIVVVAAAVAF